MSWTLITAIYDIFYDIFYDNLRLSTAFYGIYGILRQPTTSTTCLRHVYDILRQVYDILRHTRLRHVRGFFETFASIRLLLTFTIMDNIEAWLPQVHGILQGNADGFQSSLVFGNAMPEQSTKAIIKLESAVELLLTSASSQFGDGSGGELDGRAAKQAAISTAQRLEWPR
jgi:hypothetical protein